MTKAEKNLREALKTVAYYQNSPGIRSDVVQVTVKDLTSLLNLATARQKANKQLRQDIKMLIRKMSRRGRP